MSRHLDGRLLVAAGALNFDDSAKVETPLNRGFRVVVNLTGGMALRASKLSWVDVSEPTVCVLLSDEDHPREQIFKTGETYRFALVQMDPVLVQAELGLDPYLVLSEEAARDRSRLTFALRAASPPLQAVAAQILTCPLGPVHNLYRIAKAFELVALALEVLAPAERAKARRAISKSDRERLQAAHDQLLLALQAPPSLSEVADRVGLNARKLTEGFRQVFGTTPYAFVQEQRLQAARRQLAAGESSIAEAAYAVGYSPAHFATAFRRRFGIAPSTLVRGGADKSGTRLS